MRLRTIALAVALACGFTAIGEAKKNVVRPAAKSLKVKKANRARHVKKGKKGVHHKVVKHR